MATAEKTPQQKELSSKQQGLIAEGIMGNVLVPNRRVIVESKANLLYESTNYGDSSFRRRLTIVDTQDGLSKELIVESEWSRGHIREAWFIRGGSVEFTLSKNGASHTWVGEEAEQLGNRLIRLLL